MSLVGPRPLIRRYVRRYNGFYDEILHARPGLTGLGTLRFVQHEQRMLRRCQTAAQTDRAYERHCLQRKARVDLVYLRHRSVGLDLLILWHTACAFVCAFQLEAPLPLRRNRVSFARWIKHCFHLVTGSARALWQSG
jgi:lipopolysaccharide/colanic/teichoic acid biosynthesis glycosyltransferase